MGKQKKSKAEQHREVSEGLRGKRKVPLNKLSPDQLELVQATIEGKKRRSGKGKER